MDRRNQRNEDIVRGVAGVAIGAAAVYAGFKLFETLFSSNEPHENQAISDGGKPPQSLPFRITSPHRFPENSKIYVVNTTEECKYAMNELKSHCDEYGVLGFDCEWVSQQGIGRNPVALIQLASPRGLCVLVRLSELRHIPDELKDILEDSSILKVGVATHIDKKFLFEDYLRQHQWDDYNSIRGTFELGRLATMVNCEGERRGLSYLSETYLGVSLDKNPNLRCCDWEDDTLSNAEITYAATDAMVAIEIFKVFATKFEPNGIYRNRMIKTIDACLEKIEMDDSHRSQFRAPNSYASFS